MKVASNKALILACLAIADLSMAGYLGALVYEHVYIVMPGPASGIMESSPGTDGTVLDTNNSPEDAANTMTVTAGKVGHAPETAIASGNETAAGPTIGQLFILDRIFNDDDMLNRNETTLGDIYILDRLFGRDGASFDGQLNRMGNLLILNQLFGRTGSPILDGKATLGNLFILNQLFDK